MRKGVFSSILVLRVYVRSAKVTPQASLHGLSVVQRQTQRHTVVAHRDPPQLPNGAPIVYYEVVYIAGGVVRMKRVRGSVTGVRLQGFAQAQAIKAKVIAINGMGRSEPSSPRYTVTHPGPAD